MWLNRITVMLRPLWGLYWDFEVHGAVDEVPRKGPLLLVANHASFLDPWFLSILFPRGLRHLINQSWYERSFLWKMFFDANGTVPTSTKDPEGTFEAVRAVLDRGRTVCIFPEGRISKDGRMRRFRSGIAWMAAKTGAPVVPVGIRGAFESISQDRRWPKRCKIEIHIGQLVRFSKLRDGEQPSMQDLMSFRDRLESDVRRLAGQGPLARVVHHPRTRRMISTQNGSPRKEPDSNENWTA